LKTKPELLSPVQDWISLKAAIDAGCDAVYFGVKGLNMRANAKNFLLKELWKIVDFCHKKKVKAYLTLNTIVFDNEIDYLKKVISEAKAAKIDAIICWDLLVIDEAAKKKIPVFVSTQASIANIEAAKVMHKKFGVKRVVLAREVPLPFIKRMVEQIHKEKLDIGIETFVHGAMCVSVSGRCFMSQEVFGKSANRGACLQPCRRKYMIKDVEEGFEFELGEDYVMSPKDLCTIEFIDKLIEAGICSFKIEGRNRSAEYVKVVTECYREAIDAYYAGRFNPEFAKILKQRLETVYNRGFSTGFYLGKPVDEWAKVYGSKATNKKVLIGYVKNYYKKPKAVVIKLEQHSLKIGDELMIQGPTTGVVSEKIKTIHDEKGNLSRKVFKGKIISCNFSKIARRNDKVYLVVNKDIAGQFQ